MLLLSSPGRNPATATKPIFEVAEHRHGVCGLQPAYCVETWGGETRRLPWCALHWMVEANVARLINDAEARVTVINNGANGEGEPREPEGGVRIDARIHLARGALTCYVRTAGDAAGASGRWPRYQMPAVSGQECQAARSVPSPAAGLQYLSPAGGALRRAPAQGSPEAALLPDTFVGSAGPCRSGLGREPVWLGAGLAEDAAADDPEGEHDREHGIA